MLAVNNYTHLESFVWCKFVISEMVCAGTPFWESMAMSPHHRCIHVIVFCRVDVVPGDVVSRWTKVRDIKI